MVFKKWLRYNTFEAGGVIMKKVFKVIMNIVLYYLIVIAISFLFLVCDIKIDNGNWAVFLIFILPFFVVVFIHQIVKLYKNSQYNKVIPFSIKYKKLVDLNSKYKFNDITKTKLTIKENEYSRKGYERARAKNIILYHIENNELNVRDFIAKAHENKCIYDDYLCEFNNINDETPLKEIQKTGFTESQFRKYETKLLEIHKIKENIYNISIKVVVNYTTPSGKYSYSKNRVVEYEELVDLYLQWSNSKKYKITSKKERLLMNDKLRYDVLKRDNFSCKICGITAKDGAKLHVDHIVPVSKGGQTTISNLQTLCDRCNFGKSDK